MYAIDFEYDGQYLSDYDMIICHFDYSSGSATASAGSKISFGKVSRNFGKLYGLTNTSFDECVTTTFDICKNPDRFEDYSDRQITNDEYRDLMRWLNRREFLKFQVFDEDDKDRDTCYYNASFNIEKIKIGEKLFGLRLTMESDRPFGYGQTLSVNYTFANSSVVKILIDMSDEVGYIYPDVQITCNSAGTLSIYNELLDATTQIKNCSNGEIITLKGTEQIISSSNTSHDICNDFNYEFFRIGNTIQTRANKISVSIPCEIEITYNPIIKDTP